MINLQLVSLLIMLIPSEGFLMLISMIPTNRLYLINPAIIKKHLSLSGFNQVGSIDLKA